MNKWIWIIVVAALVFGGAMILNNRQTGVPAEENLQGRGENVQGAVTGETKTFDIAGQAENNRPAFSLKEIKVKEGDRVVVNFTNTSTFSHDFTLTDFGIKTRQLQPNESETVEFVADKKGTFEYFCSVGNHRQMGMVGKLIVE